MMETDMLTVAKRKARSGVFRLKRLGRRVVQHIVSLPHTVPRMGTRGVRRVKYTRIVERMHLAVCTPCQYDCVSCSHQGIRYQYRNYHLPLDDLRAFLHFTEASGYFIERLHITGPGEPLLWKNLREGLAVLRASPAIGCIDVVTNGLELERLDEASWACIDILRISLYPASTHILAKVQEAQRTHGRKIIVRTFDTFRTAPAPGATAPIPCRCACSGPMYFDRKVFFFCGPTVFSAADSKGVNVLDYPEMYGEIGPDYLGMNRYPGVGPGLRRLIPLAVVDPEMKIGNHELCKFCPANNNIKRPNHGHIALPQLGGVGSAVPLARASVR